MNPIFCKTLLWLVSGLTLAGLFSSSGFPSRINSPGGAVPRARGPSTFDETVAPLLREYCLDCHTGEHAEGGVDLARLDSRESILADLEFWQSAVQAVEAGYMPPAGEAQPPARAIDALQNWHQLLMQEVAARQQPRTMMRRLNRVEYENTIRDLFRMTTHPFDNPARVLISDHYFQPHTRRMPHHVLAVSYFSYGERKVAELPGLANLPADPPVEHGFNNNASSLSCSPLQIEAYLEIAQQLLANPGLPRVSAIWDTLFVEDSTPGAASALEQAETRLATFLPRAFRRPLTDDELHRYVDLFDRQFARTGSFNEAMRVTVSAVLASPRFLFRRDLCDPADDYAMASRLSYFLWGTMPDDALWQAAREGRLSSAAGLRRQVRRMMRDPKIRSLSTDFGMQWLKTHKAALAQPDADQFPHYYQATRSPPGVAMMIEQMLLFETILVEDRSILDFINADFTWLNRNLMDWYGLDRNLRPAHVPGIGEFEEFFRVQWPDDRRGGVLTSGAMLVATSTTTRSSPVLRGAWVLDVIFNRPPPPPPADVPSLESVQEDMAEPANVRERLEQHRRDPTCAVCHDRIDPVGFAFEQFNPVAQFRTGYADRSPVDSSGAWFGQPTRDATDLKRLIVQEKRRFVTGFVEHMLKYALGRQLHPTDAPEIQRIVDMVLENDCRFSVVVEEIASGSLFRSEGRPPSRYTRQPALTR